MPDLPVPSPFPAVSLPAPRTRAWGYAGAPKRALDLVLVILALPPVLVLLALLALLVRRDGGPAFFAQPRIGRGGRPFACWKLRTMAPDAQHRLHDLLARDATARAQWDTHRKLSPDPRVTPLGRALRAASLDELPQLWNVLRGDMSLVGPRPVPHDELHIQYGPAATAYCLRRPGLTGLWQVSGRNRLAYADRVRLDMTYCAAPTLRGDLAILARTLGVVARRTGQ